VLLDEILEVVEDLALALGQGLQAARDYTQRKGEDQLELLAKAERKGPTLRGLQDDNCHGPGVTGSGHGQSNQARKTGAGMGLERPVRTAREDTACGSGQTQLSLLAGCQREMSG
jgi:acetyl-CoA acetyltransferase